MDPARGAFVRGETVTPNVARGDSTSAVTFVAADSGRFANPTAIVLFITIAWIVLGLAVSICVRRGGDFSAIVIAATFPPHRTNSAKAALSL